MQWRWAAGTCRMLANAAPPIKGINQLMWTVWGGVVWSSSSNWPPRSMVTTAMTNQCCQSEVDNDGNDSNGGDGTSNGDSDSKGDDAAAATISDDVNDGNLRVSRTAEENSNWTTTMGRQQFNGNGWPATCRMLASAAPPIQGKNQLKWRVLGAGEEREGRFGGIEPQK
jgi:hypothetical protein